MMKQREIHGEMQKPRSNRNPIKFHGDRPTGSFTQVANELIRDNTLSTDARMTAILLLSHDEGFEVSAASLALVMNRNRKTIFKALRQLDVALRVITQPYLTAAGKPAFKAYHVRRTGHFTEAEAAQLRVPFHLPAPVHPEDAGKPRGGTGGSPPLGRGEVRGEDYKEDHLKHQIEEKAEEPPLTAGSCVLCMQPIGDDETPLDMQRHGFDGTGHECCVTRWFFEDVEGQPHYFRMRKGSKRERQLAEALETSYWKLTKAK